MGRWIWSRLVICMHAARLMSPDSHGQKAPVLRKIAAGLGTVRCGRARWRFPRVWFIGYSELVQMAMSRTPIWLENLVHVGLEFGSLCFAETTDPADPSISQTMLSSERQRRATSEERQLSIFEHAFPTGRHIPKTHRQPQTALVSDLAESNTQLGTVFLHAQRRQRAEPYCTGGGGRAFAGQKFGDLGCLRDIVFLHIGARPATLRIVGHPWPSIGTMVIGNYWQAVQIQVVVTRCGRLVAVCHWVWAHGPSRGRREVSEGVGKVGIWQVLYS
ncbi:uncharacterized protein EV422DRAFT_503421 [Fimicolochytrium jonesii]|uniref:uncharacterized protein n=1 Tax=Fimicolochytrium jonesii TaxID=1396493 RepID=UPI0022FEB152|nr:uncharacterized protein EV422DRAFT_503421 [Fimicolochytrium jonesii]KAI8826097.1 hypothetical protein EV422DRAFT_503421 [Fimicolochytrium jonesii]